MVGGENSNTGKKAHDDRCDRTEVAGQTGSVASSNSLLTAVLCGIAKHVASQPVVNLSVAVHSVKRVLRLLPGLIAQRIRLARADVLRHQAGKEMQYSHLISPAFDWAGSSSPLRESKVAVLYGKRMSRNCSNFGSRASQMLWFVANVFVLRI